MLPPLFDSHCHLYAEQFSNDLRDVLRRAKEHAVEHIMVPGENILSSRNIINLCARYTNVHIHAAAGIHPEYAEKESTQIEILKEIVQSPQVKAIGEIGLDYYWMDSGKEIQKNVFAQCLNLALMAEKPVIIHNRESTADMLAILRDWVTSIPVNSRLKQYSGVLHAYNGDHDILEFIQSSGFFIGIGGPMTFKNARQLQEVLPELPLEKILVETDSPYLSPHPHRGERNEPANVRFVIQKIAELLEMDVREITKITTKNALELFHIEGVK